MSGRYNNMNYEEQDNLRNDGSDKNIDPSSKQTVGKEEIPQSVFSVGGNNNPSAGQRTAQTSHVSMPEYRYTYSSLTNECRDKKQCLTHRKSKVGLIALVIAAAMLFSAAAGFGGAMIANSIMNTDKTSTTGDETTDANDRYNLPNNSGEGEDSSIVIIKSQRSEGDTNEFGKIGDDNLALTDVVRLVKDSVVEISTGKAVYNGAVVESGAGSGVIYGVSADEKTAYILTNNHVVEGADKILVRLTDGREYEAAIKGSDAVSDVAIIAIKPEGAVTTATIGDSGSLLVGESVIAIGNPLGRLGGTVTNGIISSLAREVEISGRKMTLLQISAAVNPGNSGGGLFNMRGELIGIVNAKSAGSNVDNIGFAIPMNTAYHVANELYNYGYVTGRVDTGLELITINSAISAFMQFGSPNIPYGVYVVSSEYTNDIKWGDRIISINDTIVSSESDVNNIISNYAIGDTVKIKISRANKLIEVELTLVEDKPAELNTVSG